MGFPFSFCVISYILRHLTTRSQTYHKKNKSSFWQRIENRMPCCTHFTPHKYLQSLNTRMTMIESKRVRIRMIVESLIKILQPSPMAESRSNLSYYLSIFKSLPFINSANTYVNNSNSEITRKCQCVSIRRYSRTSEIDPFQKFGFEICP